jgi:hypothetical protein
MFTSATPSTDGNNANISQAEIRVYSLNSSLQRVSDDAAADAYVFSPVACIHPSSFSGGLSLTVASGATEEIVLGVGADVSATPGGHAFASLDPSIFVDPHFSDAGEYSIELSPGVGNGLPVAGVPEPTVWTMLLIVFAGLGLRPILQGHRRDRLWAAFLARRAGRDPSKRAARGRLHPLARDVAVEDICWRFGERSTRPSRYADFLLFSLAKDRGCGVNF